jgi:hypothetical protein
MRRVNGFWNKKRLLPFFIFLFFFIFYFFFWELRRTNVHLFSHFDNEPYFGAHGEFVGCRSPHICYTYIYIYTIKGRKETRGERRRSRETWEGVYVYEGEGEGGINLPIGDADNDNDKINYQNYKNYQTVYYFKTKYLQN